MALFYRCLFGPRMSKMYQRGTEEEVEANERRRGFQVVFEGRNYHGNLMENFSDGLIRTAMFSISLVWSLGIYTYPFIALWLHRRGYFNLDYIPGYGRLASAITVLFISLMITRSFGRMMNDDYVRFINILEDYKASRKLNLKLELGNFDFDFREWPIDFRYDDPDADNTTPRKYLEKRTSRRTNMMDRLQSLPCGIISYIAIHTFGRRLIYPGSLSVIHILLFPVLMKGRARFVERYRAIRYKLLSRDGNEIDSMVVDRRTQPKYPHGKILVICCEGNSGFYEYGITNTPLESGFSVLGWNHPGFAGSTGVPFPDQEANAMDVVMQFAINKLKFKPENIVIYAWSIGGFTATWASMNYPNIKGMVLDATFDDLVPLAVARMPPSWKPLVVRTVRDYMDLNNGEQLLKFQGPFFLIRRIRDEMISTKPSRSLQTNRGNDLLVKLLQYRYPSLITDQTLWILQEWIIADDNRQNDLWTEHGVEEDICTASVRSYISEHSPHFPMHIGDGMSDANKYPLILFLAQKHLMDYDSTHCAPLPPQNFFLPWTPYQNDPKTTAEESKL